MYIERVSYQRTFNLGNFNSERIGVDFILHQGEDEVQALENAKRIVEDTHKKNYPNLVVSNEPIIEQVLSKEEITANTVEEIAACITVEELLTFRTFATKHSNETFNAYRDKLKELTEKK